MTEQRRAWAWPVGIATGLGLVVIANAIMISIAISHPSTPASDDHWAESLAWDQELALREHSVALGWSIAAIGWQGEGLALRVVDRDGRSLAGLRGTVTLERADTAAHDLRVELRELEDGRYLADGAADQRGLVRLTLDVTDTNGERFVTRQQLELETLPTLDEVRL